MVHSGCSISLYVLQEFLTRLCWIHIFIQNQDPPHFFPLSWNSDIPQDSATFSGAQLRRCVSLCYLCHVGSGWGHKSPYLAPVLLFPGDNPNANWFSPKSEAETQYYFILPSNYASVCKIIHRTRYLLPVISCRHLCLLHWPFFYWFYIRVCACKTFFFQYSPLFFYHFVKDTYFWNTIQLDILKSLMVKFTSFSVSLQ